MEATQTVTDLRFPIGKFHRPGDLTETERAALIDQIAEAPARLREAVRGLTLEQLETPYRPQGWTVRQVIHHLPDSHMNAYCRFKLGLTEERPAVQTYQEALWAELPDTKDTPPNTSIVMLEALHQRWVSLLRSMSASDFGRSLNHPEMGEVTLERMLAIYAWHGRHHVAHITSLRERMGWSSGAL